MINTLSSSRGMQLLVNVSVLLIVILWTLPTLGLLVSSIRDKTQITQSGWWASMLVSETTTFSRAAPSKDQIEMDGQYVLSGTIPLGGKKIIGFGTVSKSPTAYVAGETVKIADGKTLMVSENGDYVLSSDTPWTGKKGKRIFYNVAIPPKFTTDNYEEVLTSEGLLKSFYNSLTVSIPATVLPVLIAAFAAYALSWMQFPGRVLFMVIIVGLLVVPLQMSLIPLLKIYNGVGAFFGVGSKTYMGVWLAHTGFGLPLAIYLLRNYMAGLPKEMIESAKVEGATHYQIFMKIVLPLSFPALASFAIFQFLWVWNDLLIAMVFLGNGDEQLVLTGRLRDLLGSRGGNWEILTSSAFITIIVPLCVFFGLQRYLVSGLLTGSVKGE